MQKLLIVCLETFACSGVRASGKSTVSRIKEGHDSRHVLLLAEAAGPRDIFLNTIVRDVNSRRNVS